MRFRLVCIIAFCMSVTSCSKYDYNIYRDKKRPVFGVGGFPSGTFDRDGRLKMVNPSDGVYPRFPSGKRANFKELNPYFIYKW